MLGIPDNGRRITFRLLHVFVFCDGLVRPRRSDSSRMEEESSFSQDGPAR
jgi:predicted ester cyclase